VRIVVVAGGVALVSVETINGISTGFFLNQKTNVINTMTTAMNQSIECLIFIII